MKIHQSTQSTVRNEDQAANTNVRRLSGLIWTCSILLVLVATTAAYFVWMMRSVHLSNAYDTILSYGLPQLYGHCLPLSNCGDGQVYVGRGWHGQGQHLKGYGAVSLGIAFIGTFVNVAPPPLQVRAFKLLMDEGVRLHKLHADYHIYAHRQLRTTESPGQKLFEMMKHWPRWSADVTSLRSLNKEPLRFVPRSSWLAQPPQYNMPDLELPVKSVRFESTSSEPCSTQASCVLRVRSLQTEHIENLNRQDINYNFVVGGDGNVYVGRGWDYSCETPPTDERQFNGLIVGFVGLSKHTSSQMNVSQQLLAQGIKLGKLVPDYQLIDKSK
ncbi:GH22479 [Drosophila grimshawi]|uniref:GH22479 n=1 Tax=Drosophila grimshawi TaxID=7222 RepID=B4K1V5_DROGR|nr:GH22479 [Drosophila grimshawi]